MERVALGWIDAGSVRGEFMHSVLSLSQYEQRQPDDRYELVDFIRMTGAYIPDNRNKLVRLAREAEVDWLLMLDADESFGSDLLRILMRSADSNARPIVTGLYANIAQFDMSGGVQVINMVFGEIEDGQYRSLAAEGVVPFRVDAFGTGVCLLHMSVFDHVEEPWFWLDTLLATGKSEAQLVTEDISFCRKAREAGYELWCDPLADVTHWKSMPLTSSTVREYLTNRDKAEASLEATANAPRDA